MATSYFLAGPGAFQPGAAFFEWNGSTLKQIDGRPNVANDAAYYGHLIELPTGQILFTGYSTDVEIFTPTGTYNQARQPTITSYPTTVT